MTSTDFGTAIFSMREDGGRFLVDLPSSWMQGRTAYGGASAAIALVGALAAEPDLPPLRSAQISFVGPVSGEVEIRPSLLRRGRSAVFVSSQLLSNGGLGLAATFLFASDRVSHVEHLPGSHSELPERGAPIHVPAEVAFAQNFELTRAGGPTGGALIRRWAKLKERSRLPGEVELLLIADVLPAAAMKLFDRPPRISTMTWQLNLLTPSPSSPGGWWLVSAEASVAQAGFSSQSMQVWNSDGRPVATALQTVALFG